jgi:hypothetical protein
MTKRCQRGEQKLYIRGQTLWLLFTSLVSLGHCIACPLIYELCLPLWYLLSLYCLSSDLWLLFRQYNDQEMPKRWTEVVYQRTDNTMTKRYQRGKQKSYIRGQTIQWPRDTKEVNRTFTSLVSLGHCIACPLIYEFCLPFWYLLSLYCLSSDLWLLFTSLVSLGHCIVCPLVYKQQIRGQKIQWPGDTKEVNRSRISEHRQYNDQEIPKR